LEGSHAVAVGARLAAVLVENALALVVIDIAVCDAVRLPEHGPILQKFGAPEGRNDVAAAVSEAVHLHRPPLLHVGLVKTIGTVRSAFGALHPGPPIGKFENDVSLFQYSKLLNIDWRPSQFDAERAE
jgi:hypothetical protein